MKRSQIVIILLGLLSNVSIWAQDGTSIVPVSAPAPEQKPVAIGVSVHSNDFKYKEPSVMTQSGRMNGLDVFGLFKVADGISILGNIDYSTGKLEYDGALMNGTPYKAEDKYTVLDLSAVTRFYTEISFSTPIYFSAGLGRRVTEDANDPSPKDYRRQHIYNYLSLGAAMDVPIGSNDMTTFSLGFDNMLSGNVKTYLSDVDSSYPDLDMSFKGGSAMKASVKFTHQFNFGQVFGGINYTKWTLSESEVARAKIGGKSYQFVEPKNETTVLGIQAGIIF